jgi:pantoate kinase
MSDDNIVSLSDRRKQQMPTLETGMVLIAERVRALTDVLCSQGMGDLVASCNGYVVRIEKSAE